MLQVHHFTLAAIILCIIFSMYIFSKSDYTGMVKKANQFGKLLLYKSMMFYGGILIYVLHRISTIRDSDGYIYDVLCIIMVAAYTHIVKKMDLSSLVVKYGILDVVSNKDEYGIWVKDSGEYYTSSGIDNILWGKNMADIRSLIHPEDVDIYDKFFNTSNMDVILEFRIRNGLDVKSIRLVAYSVGAVEYGFMHDITNISHVAISNIIERNKVVLSYISRLPANELESIRELVKTQTK